MAYVLYAGLARRSDRRAAIAAAVVAAERLVFVGNRCRCPLTQLAARLGAEQGSVTDIYLPTWFARNLPAIHVQLIVLAALLHARNLRTYRRRPAA
jgi:predicted kinase